MLFFFSEGKRRGRINKEALVILKLKIHIRFYFFFFFFVFSIFSLFYDQQFSFVVIIEVILLCERGMTHVYALPIVLSTNSLQPW